MLMVMITITRFNSSNSSHDGNDNSGDNAEEYKVTKKKRNLQKTYLSASGLMFYHFL